VLELLPQAVEELARTGEPLRQQINAAAAKLPAQERAAVDAFLGTLVTITEEHAHELRTRALERTLM
jgi:hypothetical protein